MFLVLCFPGFLVEVIMRIVTGIFPDIQPNEDRKLIRNIIRFKKCNNVIESKSVHHCVWCPCGAVGVDGGLEYNRVMGEVHDYESLHQWLISAKDGA